MGIDHLLTTPITVMRQTYIDDEFGDHRRGPWETNATVNGWFDSNLRRAVETVTTRDEANSDGVLFLPAGTDILPTDRVEIGGLLYQVFGVPAPIPMPGGTHHIEMQIKRYIG